MYTYVHTDIHISEYIWESVFIICWKCALISLKIPFVSWAHYLRMYVCIFLQTCSCMPSSYEYNSELNNRTTTHVVLFHWMKTNKIISYRFISFCLRQNVYGGVRPSNVRFYCTAVRADTCERMDGHSISLSVCSMSPSRRGSRERWSTNRNPVYRVGFW